MAPQRSTVLIGVLIVCASIISISTSYIPAELVQIRQGMTVVLVGFMVVIATLTVRSVLKEF
jgi:predicted membrane channel-forming protein YqfA (hemolysin III family)